jgi:hypothetical protein
MMRSKVLLALVLVLIVGVRGATAQQAGAASTGQTAATKSASSGGRQKLGDDFSKAALRALKAIQGDASTPDLRAGNLYVDRQTQEAIDNADVEARTSGERAIVELLNSLYVEHLILNLTEQNVALKYEIDSDAVGRDNRKLDASDKTAGDPEVQRRAKRESACASALDGILRARAFAAPAACAHLKPE